MIETLNNDEVEALLRALSGITAFFRSKYKKLLIIDTVKSYVASIEV